MATMTIEPTTLVEDEATRDLLAVYEAVLTEMRTHARAPQNHTIRQWVERIDAARDEFVQRA